MRTGLVLLVAATASTAFAQPEPATRPRGILALPDVERARTIRWMLVQQELEPQG